jgi:transposase
MRQVHRGGEKLFVDFAGTRVPVFDPETGARRDAEIFVATWGASSYTYAEAVWSQDLPTWTMLHVHALNFFGCAPKIVVPDNLKSGITRECRYDPDVNETYCELARHCPASGPH